MAKKALTHAEGKAKAKAKAKVIVRHTTQANINRFFDVTKTKVDFAKAKAKAKAKKPRAKAKVASVVRDTTKENVTKFFASSHPRATPTLPSAESPSVVEIIRQWCASDLRKATRVEQDAAPGYQHSLESYAWAQEHSLTPWDEEQLAEARWDLALEEMIMMEARENADLTRQLMKQLSALCR